MADLHGDTLMAQVLTNVIIGNTSSGKDICFDDDFLCYIAPKRKASLFKAAYRDVAELIQEFREKLIKQGVDPRGFPPETCVCSLSCTYFC